MKNYILTFITFFIVFYSYSQQYTVSSKKAIKLYEQGIEHYELYENIKAKNILLSAIEIEPKFVEAYLILADIYKAQFDSKNELLMYQQIVEINPDFFPYSYYNYGTALYQEGYYQKAIKNLQYLYNYDNINPEILNKAQSFIDRSEFAIELMKHPVNFLPVNLGDSINTKYDEYWPSLSADESTLMITVLLPKKVNNKSVLQEDFYISHRIDAQNWSKVKTIGLPINTNGNEGAQALFVDGINYLFTACNRYDGIGGCDLYFVDNKNDQKALPLLLPIPINTRFSEKQPSISFNGKTIYFSSNRPGGKGKMDIWSVTIAENGKWSDPINLGDSINTSGDEISPFIHFDDKTLYFSSNFWLGMGDFDIFLSRKDSNNQWQKPVNLGYPINTNKEEIGFIVNAGGTRAYYSANRKESKGKDIYYFDLPKSIKPNPVSYVKGNVFDEKTGKKLIARIELFNIMQNYLLADEISDSKGNFLMALPLGGSYSFNVYCPGYLFYSENFNLIQTSDTLQPYEIDIPLQAIEIGKTFVLKNIFFDTDSSELKPESEYELNQLVRFLNEYSEIELEIGGHTDNMGSDNYNNLLSHKRAQTVYLFLIQKRIHKSRLTYKGYGKTKSIDTNKTKIGRANNRRTEFIITAK